MAPLVADYLDPHVDAATWVSTHGAIYGELQPKVRAMTGISLKFTDETSRDVVMAVVETYRAKLVAVSELVNADSEGDQDAERQAQEDLDTASREATRLAEELIGLASE